MNTLTNFGNQINDGGIKTVEDLENNIVKGYLGLFKDCKVNLFHEFIYVVYGSKTLLVSLYQ